MAPEEASDVGTPGAQMRTEFDYGPRYRRWDEVTEFPLAVVALSFLIVYAYLVLANTRPTEISWPPIFLIAVWVIFALHYVISLALVRHRGHWFLTHLHELAMAALPFLRPLQLLRLVKVVAVMHRTMGSALRGKVSVYVAGVSGMLVLVGSLGVLDAEQNAEGANITSFGDAIWWAVVTISSVGYGDYYPVTTWGRLIAIGLMIAGIALISSVTATIASWFVERIVQAQEQVAGGAGESRSGEASSQGPEPGDVPRGVQGQDAAPSRDAGPGGRSSPDRGAAGPQSEP